MLCNHHFAYLDAILLISYVKCLVVNSFISSHFVFFHGSFKDAYLLHRLFTSSIILRYFTSVLLLFSFLVCTYTIYKHNTFIRLFLPPSLYFFLVYILFVTRFYLLASRFLADFSSRSFRRVLFYRLPPPAFQFSSSLLVHSLIRNSPVFTRSLGNAFPSTSLYIFSS